MSTTWKTFIHPHSVYRLEFPAEWDQVTERDGESCGFGPKDRDDIGLWISILPISADTEKMEADLPKLMEQSTQNAGAAHIRRDTTLRHFGLIADNTENNQGGNCWILCGGDTVLFASTQVPSNERETWNPLFFHLMSSLQITRDVELQFRRLSNDVMARLKAKLPDHQWEYEGNKIRGSDRMIYLGNLFREIQDAPETREQRLIRFVDAVCQQDAQGFGQETWDESKPLIMPALKPKNYIVEKTATASMLTREWLGDVLVCYAICHGKTLRYVTGWDVNRWGTTAEALDEIALANLAEKPWPKKIAGARTHDDAHVMIIETDDSLGSSRLLHPELHRLFSGPLGVTFWAGVPCRNRLVLFPDRRKTKQRIDRQLKRDHDGSSYPVTPKPFLVTRDGIALGR